MKYNITTSAGVEIAQVDGVAEIVHRDVYFRLLNEKKETLFVIPDHALGFIEKID